MFNSLNLSYVRTHYARHNVLLFITSWVIYIIITGRSNERRRLGTWSPAVWGSLYRTVLLHLQRSQYRGWGFYVSYILLYNTIYVVIYRNLHGCLWSNYGWPTVSQFAVHISLINWLYIRGETSTIHVNILLILLNISWIMLSENIFNGNSCIFHYKQNIVNPVNTNTILNIFYATML